MKIGLLIGVLLLFVAFPVKSASALVLTIPRALGRSVITLGECIESVNKYMQTTKLDRMGLSTLFACRVHHVQRKHVHLRERGGLTLSKCLKGNNSDLKRFHLLTANELTPKLKTVLYWNLLQNHPLPCQCILARLE